MSASISDDGKKDGSRISNVDDRNVLEGKRVRGVGLGGYTEIELLEDGQDDHKHHNVSYSRPSLMRDVDRYTYVPPQGQGAASSDPAFGLDYSGIREEGFDVSEGDDRGETCFHVDEDRFAGMDPKSIKIPRSHPEVLRSPQKEFWLGAEDSENESIEEAGTYARVTEVISDPKAILNCMWVYSLKIVDGKIVGFKARLVVLGNRRIAGVDHTNEEAHTSVLKMQTLRGGLACAVQDREAKVDHWDIRCAFLAGRLPKTKVIYMRLAPGARGPGSVVRLEKALYGLPEAMSIFCDLLAGELLKLEFTRGDSDQSLFVLRREKEYVIVPAFVDDMYPIFNSSTLKNWVLSELEKIFNIKDLGSLKFSLGIRFDIDCEKGVIFMDQEHLMRDILDMTGMSGCNLTKVAMEPNLKLEKLEETEPEFRDRVHMTVLGMVNYLVTCTGPQFAQATSVLQQHQMGWGSQHQRALNYLLRFIKGQLLVKLIYRRQVHAGFSKIVLFSDADFAGQSPWDSRSRTGVLAFLYGCLIYWSSKRQSMTATSTTESETMAAHSTVIEAVWERRLAKDLGHPETGPTLVWEDNRQVILHANHDGLHRATKHFLTKYHYKRELVAEGIVVFQPLATNRMLADYLTKSVPRIKSVFMREAFLGIADCPEKHGIISPQSEALLVSGEEELELDSP